MKILSLAIIALLAITTISCSKNDDNAASSKSNQITDGFTWTENAVTTILTVNNPYATAQYKSIFALRQGVTIYEINLTSLAVGTYPIGANNSMFYNNNGSTTGNFSPTSGSVIITANANNKLSGTFTATGSGNGVTTVSGQFNNIVINP
jgi:hypothetical protein